MNIGIPIVGFFIIEPFGYISIIGYMLIFGYRLAFFRDFDLKFLTTYTFVVLSVFIELRSCFDC